MIITFLCTHPMFISLFITGWIIAYYIKEERRLFKVYKNAAIKVNGIKQDVNKYFIKDHIGLVIKYIVILLIVWNRALLFDILF